MKCSLVFVLLVLGTTSCASGGSGAATVPGRAEEHLTPQKIAERANPSVVLVTTDRGAGTGFVVAADRIATNLHVIQDASQVDVVLANGRKLRVTDVWLADNKVDLAVLKVEPTGLAPLKLAGFQTIRAGDPVTSIGNPRGYVHTVSDGVVGAVRGGPPAIVQHTAPTAPGSSGGPLFNDRAEVIGITTSVRNDAQNLNFAIAASELAPLVSTNAAPLSMAELRATMRPTSDACDPRWPDAGRCETQCTRGEATSCTGLGYLLHHGKGVSRDDAKAATLYKRGCDEGDVLGCADLGVLYRDGEGVARDARRAADLFQVSCDRGLAWACQSIGELYISGAGVPKNSARAETLLERACDASLADACAKAAEMHEGDSRHLDRAATFYQRACDNGLPRACTKLGLMLTEGRALARDPARAAHLFQRGCAKDNPEACGRFGAVLVEGRGVSADRARGLKLLRWACSEGWGESCARVAAMGGR
jgi:TPR repeat protein